MTLIDLSTTEINSPALIYVAGGTIRWLSAHLAAAGCLLHFWLTGAQLESQWLLWICKQGFMKQLTSALLSANPAKFKIPEPQIPKHLLEMFSRCWMSTVGSNLDLTHIYIRPRTIVHVCVQTTACRSWAHKHRVGAVLENNNWPWLALDIVRAIRLWCKCLSCVGGRSVVRFRAKHHHWLYNLFPEGSTCTSGSHEMQESALKCAAEIHRCSQICEGKSQKLSRESMAVRP